MFDLPGVAAVTNPPRWEPPDFPRFFSFFSPAPLGHPEGVGGRFYASHQVRGPNRINKNLWFVTEREAELACDELWTADCRQEVVDTLSGEFRVRSDDGGWSVWAVRHP